MPQNQGINTNNQVACRPEFKAIQELFAFAYCNTIIIVCSLRALFSKRLGNYSIIYKQGL